MTNRSGPAAVTWLRWRYAVAVPVRRARPRLRWRYALAGLVRRARPRLRWRYALAVYQPWKT